MSKTRRDRGRILTVAGLKKLNDAIEEWKQDNNLKGVLVELAAESGVGSDTISKIRQGQEGADISKIQQLFTTFGLTLEKGDHRSAKEDEEEEVSDTSSPLMSTGEVTPTGTHIFISYRAVNPDAELAHEFARALTGAGHQVFLAEDHIRLGENWFQRISTELQRADYLLLLLPPQSAFSELLTYQVNQAKEVQESRPDRKPIILPIRVGFPLSEPLNYELRGYLYRIKQRKWLSPTDTPALIAEVLTVVADATAPALEPEDVTDETPPAPLAGSLPLPAAEPELPGGQVDVASQFYIERSPIEERCYETILQPSALIRIKAPRQMGKTSLMARILHYGSQQGYRTVPLSFQLVDKTVFADLDLFLKWFCAYVGRELRIPNQLDDYWDEIFGSKVNCKDYFEKYLLAQIESPLVLGLDEIDRVFQYPDIAEDFLGLLRAWHEESKRRQIWKKLRLLVVHSTEVYIPMNINQSPFNVGLPIELPEFTASQILDLAQRHQLAWSESEVSQLMAMVGGHPYLVRVALYHIGRGELTLMQLQQEALAERGVYSDHLRRHLWNLEQYPDLAEVMTRVVHSSDPIASSGRAAFQLDSLGLVKLQGNEISPRCELYRQYFQVHLTEK